MNGNQIVPNAPVVCSNNGQFATVDHMEGEDIIKLKKDKQGQHHFIPLSWVSLVDDKVHVNRPGDQAMREWSTSASGISDLDAKDDEQSNDRIANEHKRNPSSTDQKKMRINLNQEQPPAHKGAAGRTGDQNKGHAQSKT